MRSWLGKGALAALLGTLSLVATGCLQKSTAVSDPVPPAIPAITAQPANVTVNPGQTATFSVTATGATPLQYQWQRGTTAISGANSQSYTTPATTAADNGATFRVVVINSAGSITSSAATLTVNQPPSITAQPASQSVTAGQTATFTVIATGIAPLSYQWSRGGSQIPGATLASYTTAATTSADNGASFQVVVTNPAGSTPSSFATLTVTPAPVGPSITTQPAAETVTVGQTATFSVVATGTAPLSYQWQRGNTPISGATLSSYTTPATVGGDDGATFLVVVTNSVSSVSSNPATLTVNTPPSITTQPANQTVNAGQTATFSVVAAGTGPLTYQWQRGTNPIGGATSSSYTTPATTSGDNNATFQVVVTGPGGNITSNSATLTVNSPPSITTQPADQTVTAGQTATFSVVATGSGTLTYQWQQGTAPISGATLSSYTTPATTTGDSGETFQVVVSDSAGSTTSTAATLTVNPATIPLSVSFTSPGSGGTVSGTIQITASVQDSDTITGVQFQVDGLNLGAPVTSSPYSVSLDTTLVANSTHTLTAVATDSSSNEASSTISTTVSNPLVGIPAGPLRVSTVNPRYFTANGTDAILLGGDHTWANLQDQGTPEPAVFDYDAYMNFMSGHNYNMMHLWTWWLPNGGTANEGPNEFSSAPFPWVRTGPGNADDGGLKFDLTQLDFNHFSRMRQRIIEAGQNGIYVSIYLFNGYEWQLDLNPNDGNPFESINNVNGLNCPDTCPTDNTLITPQAWAFEQQYLTQLINAVNDLDNVMYAVSNESPGPASTTWQASVISFVKNYEATLPKQHPVGMVFQFKGGTDQTLYDSAADWVSPSFGGQNLAVPSDATGQCPNVTGNGGAINSSSPNCKVVVNDTDHDCGACGDQAWAWENFTRGNSMLFMDQYLVYAPESIYGNAGGWNNNPGGPCVDGQCTTLDPQWDPVRNAISDVMVYANSKLDLINMTPQDSLSTSGFCLANPGSQYLVYSLSGGFILTTVPGTYTYEWFNPSTHAVISTGSITVGASQSFTPSFGGDAVLWLHQ